MIYLLLFRFGSLGVEFLVSVIIFFKKELLQKFPGPVLNCRKTTK
jgi:hypothetical protein